MTKSLVERRLDALDDALAEQAGRLRRLTLKFDRFIDGLVEELGDGEDPAPDDGAKYAIGGRLDGTVPHG